ncbi:MAG: hypothetical protein CMB80_05200 [Flammeovirgaceae bacterium]|nr:hypothetical protein [Flammeovirgaceae bacterium]MBE62708.1 hypothetical protein [Flammeovirgaceae bacterium]HCX23001.1 hypothetical protein [Cytophagales bacterium]
MRFGFALILSILLVTSLAAQELPVELRIEAGHYSSVTAMTFSDDGKILASGAYDRSIVLWDIESGRELRRINCEDNIESLDFSPDGNLILSIIQNGKGLIHEVTSGRLIKTLSVEDGYLQSGKFLPNGKEMIIAGPKVATIWSMDKDEPIAFLDGERSYCNYNCQHSMDISPDGKWMSTVDRNGQVSLWNIPKRKLINQCQYYDASKFSHSGITSIAFTPDSKSFIIGSEIQGIIQWWVDPAKEPRVLLTPQKITTGISFKFNDLAINKDGTILSAVYLEGVQDKFQREDNLGYHRFDLQTGQLIESKDVGDANDITNMIYHPVSDTLIINRGAIPQIVDSRDLSPVRLFKGHLTDNLVDYWIMKATKKHVFVPPNTIIERVGRQVFAWDYTSGKIKTTYPAHEDIVLGSAASTNQQLLATSAADGSIYVSDMESGDTLWTRKLFQSVLTVGFSPDSEQLISIDMSGRVVAWQAASGEYIQDLPRTARDWYQTPMTVAFTSTGLVTWDNALREPEKGQEVVSFDSHEDRLHDIQTSKDGKQLLTTGWDGQVFLRDLYYGGKVTPIGEKLEDKVYCAAFSPDEKLIATGAADNVIRIYQPDGTIQYELTGHRSGVVSLSFSEDGNHLISGSQDGTVKIWDLKNQKELYTHVLLDANRWTTMLPSGHFYSTQEGMQSMYFVKGNELYSLDQFFEEFYQPKLTVNLLGSNLQREASSLSNQIANKPPPKVEIVYPKLKETTEPQTELIVKVTDQGGGIEEIKVLQNGKRVVADSEFKSTKEGGSIAKSYHLDLVPGLNVIQASAFGSSRIESKADELRINRPADEPTAACYVLSIGINEYTNPRLNLNYAVDDAKSVANLIEEQGQSLFTKIETTLITNEEATRENILKKLEELSQVIKPTDVFYFFYAGHGSMMNEKFFFIPTNCTRLYEEDALMLEALPVPEVVDKLKSIKALKQVLFIDACHSGGSTQLLASRGAGEEKALAQLSRSAGVHILAAAGSDQTATEFQELGHGLFTYTVLEALKGKADGAPADEKITVYELKSFLDDQVPAYSLKYKNMPQYPNTFSIGHDFPIVLKKR